MQGLKRAGSEQPFLSADLALQQLEAHTPRHANARLQNALKSLRSSMPDLAANDPQQRDGSPDVEKGATGAQHQQTAMAEAHLWVDPWDICPDSAAHAFPVDEQWPHWPQTSIAPTPPAVSHRPGSKREASVSVASSSAAGNVAVLREGKGWLESVLAAEGQVSAPHAEPIVLAPHSAEMHAEHVRTMLEPWPVNGRARSGMPNQAHSAGGIQLSGPASVSASAKDEVRPGQSVQEPRKKSSRQSKSRSRASQRGSNDGTGRITRSRQAAIQQAHSGEPVPQQGASAASGEDNGRHSAESPAVHSGMSECATEDEAIAAGVRLS